MRPTVPLSGDCEGSSGACSVFNQTGTSLVPCLSWAPFLLVLSACIRCRGRSAKYNGHVKTVREVTSPTPAAPQTPHLSRASPKIRAYPYTEVPPTSIDPVSGITTDAPPLGLSHNRI